VASGVPAAPSSCGPGSSITLVVLAALVTLMAGFLVKALSIKAVGRGKGAKQGFYVLVQSVSGGSSGGFW